MVCYVACDTNDLCPFNTYDIDKGYHVLLGKDKGNHTFAVYNFIRYGYDGVKYTALATGWQDETRQQHRWRGMAVFLAVQLALAFNIILIIVS